METSQKYTSLCHSFCDSRSKKPLGTQDVIQDRVAAPSSNVIGCIMQDIDKQSPMMLLVRKDFWLLVNEQLVGGDANDLVYYPSVL